MEKKLPDLSSWSSPLGSFLGAAYTGTGVANTLVDQSTLTYSVVTVTVQLPEDESELPNGNVSLLEGEIPTRTPVPTAQPDIMEVQISNIVREITVDEQTFLGFGILLLFDRWPAAAIEELNL